MADGAIPTEIAQVARDGRGLTYPHPVPPGFGEAIQVAPGVLWMRLSMPIALNHINVYAVEDGDGWVLVDTGLNIPDSRDRWEALLAGPLGGKPVTPFLRFGDRVRIEMFGRDGGSLFGAIDQQVVQARPAQAGG